MKSSRILVAVLGTALAVPFAIAAGLTSPDQASIGTEHTIDASGLTLPNKPKIVLTYSGPLTSAKGDPKAKAKLVGVEGSDVTFLVKSAKGNGVFDVSIKGLAEDLGTLSMLPPDLQGVDVADAAPGDSVVLSGTFFGAKKPKVTVNGKKAKVTANDQGSITVTLSKKTPPGAGEIVVTAKTGSDTLGGQLDVLVPPEPVKGKDQVIGKFGSIAVNATAGKTGHEVVGTPAPLDGTTVFGLTLSVGSSGATTRSLSITFPHMYSSPMTGTWTGSDVVVVLGETKGGLSGSTVKGWTHSGDTISDGSSFSITVTSVSGIRISGVFDGTLVPGEGTSGGNIKGKGKFTVTLPPL